MNGWTQAIKGTLTSCSHRIESQWHVTFHKRQELVIRAKIPPLLPQ